MCLRTRCNVNLNKMFSNLQSLAQDTVPHPFKPCLCLFVLVLWSLLPTSNINIPSSLKHCCEIHRAKRNRSWRRYWPLGGVWDIIPLPSLHSNILFPFSSRNLSKLREIVHWATVLTLDLSFWQKRWIFQSWEVHAFSVLSHRVSLLTRIG